MPNFLAMSLHWRPASKDDICFEKGCQKPASYFLILSDVPQTIPPPEKSVASGPMFVHWLMCKSCWRSFAHRILEAVGEE
jgi:hypothetical protein